ncbi:hypothetical protein E2562_031792 [Oryza meyeriana var. granulata]|uniref:Uncharacterized protein n=1 Tax=Oryza meyeriana var. granulata TaxID=110450 RepID=A0A6G1EC29_9ORYZ|nr:hypothetical protein E2562_031792 [Oryza meyeriana var. granulata]
MTALVAVASNRVSVPKSGRVAARAVAETVVLSSVVAWTTMAIVGGDGPMGGGCQIEGFRVQIRPYG